MKITCIIHSLDGGGAERVMAALVTRLANRGHEVVLVTLDDGTHDRHEVGENVKRRNLNLIHNRPQTLIQRLMNRRRRVAEIRTTILQSDSDVVLSFCDRTNIDVLDAMRSTDIPVVVSERSDPAQQDLGWFWEYERRQTYKNARVVALTDTSAKHMQKFVKRPVCVIPSAVSAPPSQSDREVAQENRRIIAVGRLEYEKGFDRLLNAFAQIRKAHPDWTLRILGDGSQRESLIQQARSLRIESQVEMAGWVRPIWEELCAATVFALPSRYEGFPSALMEAMAVGLPCVAVDCESGPRAVLHDQVNGLLVDNSTQGLAAGLQRLITQAELREQIGTASKRVVDRFSWEKMVDAYEQVLSEEANART